MVFGVTTKNENSNLWAEKCKTRDKENAKQAYNNYSMFLSYNLINIKRNYMNQ